MLLEGFYLIQMVSLLAYLVFRAIKDESVKYLPFIVLQGAIVSFASMALWFHAGSGFWIEMSYIGLGIVLPGTLLLYNQKKHSKHSVQKAKAKDKAVNMMDLTEFKEVHQWQEEIPPIIEGKNISQIVNSISTSKLVPDIENVMMKVNQLVDDGQYAEAFGIYDAVSMVFPSSADILFYKGNLCYEAKKYTIARDCYLKALDMIQNSIHEAKKVSKKGSLDQSKEQSLTLPFVVSKHEVLFNLGNALFKLGKMDDAMDSYIKALEEKNDLDLAIENIAIILAMQTKTDDALTYYKNAVRNKPLTYRSHYVLARIYFILNKMELCIQELKTCLALNDSFTEGYTFLAEIFNSEERYAESVDVYNKLLKLHPQNVDILFGLGKALHNVGLYKEAIKYFAQVLEADHRCFEGYYNLALSYEKNGNEEEAMTAYKKVLEMKDGFISAYTRLWEILSSKGRFSDIVDICQAGLKNNSNEYILYYYIGVASLNMNQYSKALDAFRNVLNITSEMHSVHLYLGIALMKLNKLEEAIQTFRNALDINPDDNEVIYQISVAYSLMNRTDAALHNLKKAIELNPELKEDMEKNTAFDPLRNRSEFQALAR